MELSSLAKVFVRTIHIDQIKEDKMTIRIPISMFIMPGRNIISIPIRPISNAEILKKYIFSLRKITASIVTNKGTIKCIAVNFSNGTIAKAAKPRYIAGQFSDDLKK